MPGPFAITAATNTVQLDNNRKGQTSFTVTNTTAQALRGHARLWTQPSDADPWLSLLGEAERDFSSAESEQYSVQISVPPTVPASDYNFRLDMVDVANPDDNYSQGPTVKFMVPTPLPVKKPFPWWIVAVILGVLLLIGGSFGIIRAIQNSSANTANAHATATAQAQTFAQFDGNWVDNSTSNAGLISRLIITNSGSTITVHGFSRCHPTDCDLNTVSSKYNGPTLVIFFNTPIVGQSRVLSMVVNENRTQLTVLDNIGPGAQSFTHTLHKV